ncbi:hypothetical protein JCM10207_002459 [Rhodosporidiobolus poonsookiae]
MARPPADPDRALPSTYPSDSHSHPADMANDDPTLEQDQDEEEDDEEIYESSSSPSTETDTLTWINWFCSLPGHEYFCEVAEDFIEDDFNLTGLASLVPFYKEAMEMVLDVEPEDDESHRVPDVSIVESSAELLYGLIHQRYIITRQGLQQMYAKFDASHFGTCPRVYCAQAKLVPCGRSDLPGVDTVKLFCPSCLDMYVPPSSRFQGVDGAFFGTTFPHLLFQTYPAPSALPAPAPAPADPAKREPTTPATSLSKVYVPRIYGFKVSERARSGPRMQWMRMRPRTETELDWADAPPPSSYLDPSAGGGTGEKGELFDDDRLEDEEEDEDEEEEDAAAGGAGGAAGGAQEAQEGEAEGEVDAVAHGLQGTRLASPPGPRLPPAQDGRRIKPLPSPRSSLGTTPSATAAGPAPAAAGAASAASAALAKSIQRHLALAASGSGAGAAAGAQGQAQGMGRVAQAV